MKTLNYNQMEKSGRCELCGGLLDMQPGPHVKEGKYTFCTQAHAYEYRMSLEPINKQKQMGGI